MLCSLIFSTLTLTSGVFLQHLNRLTGERGKNADVTHLSQLTYLLNSGSNRLGGIDFQLSATGYVSREGGADLDDLHRAADMVEAGEPLPHQLGAALQGGAAIGDTDDHLRNYAAFWDGRQLELTRACDLSLTERSGDNAAPVLTFGHDGKKTSNFALLTSVAHIYGLSKPQANDIVDSWFPQFEKPGRRLRKKHDLRRWTVSFCGNASF